MNTIASIKIWNYNVGAVLWNEQKNLGVFEFDKSFLDSNLNIAPIFAPIDTSNRNRTVFSFPFLNPETYKGLPGFLADSLPDKFGNQIIDVWLAQQGRDLQSFNPVDRLCYIGKRGMGALEFEPETENYTSPSNVLEIENLVQFAKSILDNRTDFHTNLNSEKGLMDIFQIGSSAGGARAKAIIAFNETTGEVRSGQIDDLVGFDYWLIKFDGITNQLLGDPLGYGKIEYAYYLMALDCGISMMESRLMTENGRSHFMTKRFDRKNNQKIHMQTLCGLAHFDYNLPGAHSYEQTFQIMRQLKLSFADMEQLFRRMVFNVLARNQDDHAKNISFLMNSSGNWSLSPAYDVTYAYNPTNFWLKSHQMSVNGKRDNINLEDLLLVGQSASIKKAKLIIEEVQNVLLNWKKYAQIAKMDNVQTNLIENQILKIM